MKYYLVLGNSSKTFVLSCDKNSLNIGRNSDVLVFFIPVSHVWVIMYKA